MKSIFQQKVKNSFLLKNFKERQQNLLKRYNDKLSESVTSYLLEINGMEPEAAKVIFERYDKNWRLLAQGLNEVNRTILTIKEDAFSSYIQHLKIKSGV